MLREAWSDLRRVLPTISVYLLLFAAIASFALLPLASWTAGLTVRASGRLAVTNTDIAAFLLSAWGVAFIFAWGALGAAIIFARQGGLILIAWASTTGRRLSALGALRALLVSAGRLLRLGIIAIAAFGGLAIPFLAAAGLLYRLLLSERDINYYLAVQPAAWWWALGGGGVLLAGYLAIAAWLLVRWGFAIHFVLLAQSTPRDALRRSRQLVRGRSWQVVRGRIGWLAGTFLLAALVIAGLEFTAASIISALASRDVWLMAAMVLMLGVELGVVIAADALVWTGLAAIDNRLFHALLPDVQRKALPVVSAPSESTPRRPRRRLAYAAFAGLALLAAGHGYLVLSGIEMEDRTQITAHRGSSRRAPENTLAAIRAAIEDGADYVEIDVQATSDGRLVLLHDADLSRTGGVNRLIREMPFDEASRIRVGGWFDPAFADEPLPTLDQAIELCGQRIRMNIELKLDGLSGRALQSAAEEAVRIIHARQFARRCVISSLSTEILAAVEAIDPALETGFIVGASLGDFSHVEADFYSVNAAQVRSSLVLRLRERGKPLHVWTVNDRRGMWTMLDLGVDNVITDEPAAFMALKRERAKMSVAERLAESFRYRQ